MRVCITCQKEITTGTPIKEDSVIRLLRKIKSSVGIAKNNELFVCDACKPKHVEKRKAYEKSLPLWVGISVFAFIGIAGLPILNGQLSIGAFLLGLSLGGLMFIFSVFFKYVPALTGDI